MPNKTFADWWIESKPKIMEDLRRYYNKVAVIWRPILVDEGDIIPKWYGCSSYIPYPHHNPLNNPKTFKWQKVYYPIPVNVVLAWYYMVRYYLRHGCRVEPQFYTSKIFQIYTECPKCGHDLCKHPGK